MKEKKLTDEEIVKALECCLKDKKGCDKCKVYNKNTPMLRERFIVCEKLVKSAYDLIKRLQSKVAEYEQKLDDGELLSKDYHDEQVFHYVDEVADLLKENKKLKTELQKECQEHLAFAELAKKADEQQKKEIERLTGVVNRLETADKCGRRMRSLDMGEIAELQRQVDELTAFKNEAIALSLYGKGRKDGEEVAVKDTAKEILQMVECWEDKPYVSKDDFKESIKQLYGVEVEE